MEFSDEQTAKLNATLSVLAADPARLLAEERELAEQATAPITSAPFPTPRDSQPYDIEVLRRFDNAQQKIKLEKLETRDSIAAGLAAYPAAGMEPIFNDWMISGNTWGLKLWRS